MIMLYIHVLRTFIPVRFDADYYFLFRICVCPLITSSTFSTIQFRKYSLLFSMAIKESFSWLHCCWHFVHATSMWKDLTMLNTSLARCTSLLLGLWSLQWPSMSWGILKCVHSNSVTHTLLCNCCNSWPRFHSKGKIRSWLHVYTLDRKHV